MIATIATIDIVTIAIPMTTLLRTNYLRYYAHITNAVHGVVTGTPLFASQRIKNT